jgi:hypothetical protein
MGISWGENVGDVMGYKTQPTMGINDGCMGCGKQHTWY